jgi:hypothetical protein
LVKDLRVNETIVVPGRDKPAPQQRCKCGRLFVRTTAADPEIVSQSVVIVESSFEHLCPVQPNHTQATDGILSGRGYARAIKR